LYGTQVNIPSSVSGDEKEMLEKLRKGAAVSASAGKGFFSR
jgi:TRAP-type C4-dicarboxylate transport system substrate-binding protein